MLLVILSTLNFIINILWWIIIVSAIFSWLFAFNVINTRNPFVNQVAAIRDPVRRKALQTLPRTVVPSPVVVEGVTRTGRARVSPNNAYARMRDVRHFQDSLIADATAARADLLVTDDRRLAREAHDLGNDHWSSAELVDWARGRRARRAPYSE